MGEGTTRGDARVGYGFVERVLTNYWIYRNRIGQPDPSSAEAMSNSAPLYRSLDADTQTATRN